MNKLLIILIGRGMYDSVIFIQVQKEKKLIICCLSESTCQ